ncbi:MAG: hypothetical protein C9356_11785 [Oleiphilus sp.]|nr:MAG: hypothetical protein C9356_11785 [Oleiphilus sp.]
MIIGYQVQDTAGNNWGGRPSYEVLTEATATKDLLDARSTATALFTMIAVLDGDIEEPIFEKELSASREQYKAIAVSTGCLSDDERKQMDVLAEDSDCNMIMGRDTGWLVKLYDEPEYNLGYEGMGDQFHAILLAALDAGYRLVEFDSAADDFPLLAD